MKKLKVPTKRGVLLDGVLFDSKACGAGSVDTVMIAITGIHGNFYSNPFYYNIGNTLNSGGIDFINIPEPARGTAEKMGYHCTIILIEN